jgi:arginyl-tRNA synthetase
MPEPTASDPITGLRAAVAASVADLREGVRPANLERPPRAELGDYSTNAAMLAAPVVGKPPREVAEELAGGISRRIGDGVERVEVAGPGFLNLHMSEAWMRAAARHVLAAGTDFGSGVAEEPRNVNVEFVSANPTGPLTVASGRHASYGDALARVLGFAGHRVFREYYMNDAGSQIRLFGESIAARMHREEIPEGGYQGDYVAELAERIEAEGGGDLDPEALSRRGVELMVESIRSSLSRIRIEFDRWSSERELHDSGALEDVIAALRERDLVYESEDATWLRTTRFGDDKDRVLIRADGAPTTTATWRG